MKPSLRTSTEGLVSVVIAIYNSERFLAEAIESVLAQAYGHWEIKLVDDGSTDRGPEIALKYQAENPERISYFTHPGRKNLGMCATRNLGVRNSKGQYIAVLDSDDVWLPNKLEDQVTLMQLHPDVGLVYGNSEYWYDWNGDKRLSEKNYLPPLAPAGRVYYPPELLKMCNQLGPIGQPCPSDFFLRREVVEQISGFEQAFDPEHGLYEDQAFLTKIYLHVPVFVADVCWDRHRIHESSSLATSDRLGRSEASRRFFFTWLGKYLRDEQIRDKDIWKAYRRKTRSYRHPKLAARARRIRSAVETIYERFCHQTLVRPQLD